MELPEAYTKAVSETQRLFESGKLSAKRFDELLNEADGALSGYDARRVLLSGMVLFAPQEWVNAHAPTNVEPVSNELI